MTVAIITTDTSHHNFFLNKISKLFFKTIVLLEQKQIKANFPTDVLFEKREINLKRNIFLKIKSKK